MCDNMRQCNGVRQQYPSSESTPLLNKVIASEAMCALRVALNNYGDLQRARLSYADVTAHSNELVVRKSLTSQFAGCFLRAQASM